MKKKVIGYGLIILALVIAGVVGKVTSFYMTIELILVFIGSVLCVWDEFKNNRKEEERE